MPRTRNLAGAHRAHENVALPLGEFIAGVERHAGDGDRGHPVNHRWFETRMPGPFGLPGPRITAAQADDRPAVIAARLKHVDLVAAVGTVFVLPHLAGSRTQS